MKQVWHQFKKFFLVYPGIYFAKWVLRLLLSTCRINVIGLHFFTKACSKNRCILMLWHNRLMILPEIVLFNAPQYIYRAVISNSRDGELLTILTHSYKIGRVLRVPHNAKYKALSQMIKQLQQGGEVVVITPDGPRGPRYKLKQGLAVAGKESGAEIVPFSWSASSFWQLRTWDKLMIPKPFSRIEVRFGESILLGENELKSDLELLEKSLLDLDEEACQAVKKWPQ